MDKIYEYMLKLGVPMNLCGFEAMHRALEIMVSTDKRLQLTEVYQQIADEIQGTVYQVERSIRLAIIKTVEKGNQNMIQNLFGDEKLTNSLFLKKIAFILQNPANGQKTQMICVEGYKAFIGTLKIMPTNGRPYTITGEWLYRPDTHCWYGGGRSFHESYCEVV